MPISIKDFHKGQSSSPYTSDGAFAKSAGLDVFSQPGIARINYLPLKKSSTTVTELIHSFARNPSPYLATGWLDPTNCGGIFADDWTNCNKAYASDNDYATYSTGGTGDEAYYEFDFSSIPTGATITGIEVQCEIKSASGSPYLSVYISKDGANFTSAKSIQVTTSEAYHLVGGRTDLWGKTWVKSDFDVFHVKVHATTIDNTYSLDHVRVKVYYLAALDLVFAAGENGTVYKSTDAGDTWAVLAASKGRYIKIWKGYLFAILDDTINVYDIADDSWDDNWQPEGNPAGLDASSEHFMLVSENDGNLYICNRLTIASLIEDAGETFDPDTTTTYTYVSDHLTLYEPFRAICLAEQRENLLIGAIQGTPTDPRVSSSIFIWDRAAKEFEFPVFLSGEFITSMINVQNRIYVATDLFGKVYSLSEGGLTPVKQIPFDYDNDKHIRIGHKGHSGIVYWKDKILLGASSEDALSPAGIYGLSGKSVNCEYLISTGEDGSNDDVLIGALYPFDGDTLLYGYYDAENEEYGIDKIKTSYNRATSYTSYFESIFYPIGTIFTKGKIDRIVVQLSRALQSGEGVRIKYRRHIGGSWTTLATKDYATDGALSSFSFGGVKDIENIQIKCELTTGASSTNTPYIIAVHLI